MSIFDSDLQKVIKKLQDFGLTMEQIAEGIDNRVSARTLHRYKAGASAQNKHVVTALENLLIQLRAEAGKL